MKALSVAVIVAILFVPSMAPAYKQVRDGSGNLVETWTKTGDRIEVRDSHNNLKEQRRRVGDRIEVRDGSGNLIREESGDND
jgi:hypothetical protein